nr:MAG TPA: antitoxin [Caudoviricetes sp.]DAR33711.1 MAG TPA: antitoxin [Caudoviricetes sp.]
MSYTVKLFWDSEADVWIATSDDVKGLTLESGSLDVLIERVRMAVPELLKLNNQPLENAKIAFVTDRVEEVCA